MISNLTKAVGLYNKTGKGLDLITQQILTLAYAFPKLNPFCTEEDCADFLLSFYPRISRILQSYKTRGVKFEAYLQSCFLWHMKSYLTGKSLKKRREKIIYRESCENRSHSILNWEVREQDPGPLLLRPRARRKNGKEVKQTLKIILLALKCADEINDEFINKIALRLGTHSAVVFHLVEALRTTMSGRTERIKYLTQRRRESYFRLRYFMEAREVCRDRFEAAKLDKKIEREKKRFEAALKTLSITPRGPSHGDIARVLGIPKGTIDSGFFYIRMPGKRCAEAGQGERPEKIRKTRKEKNPPV
jgi:hypothetical protein